MPVVVPDFGIEKRKAIKSVIMILQTPTSVNNPYWHIVVTVG